MKFDACACIENDQLRFWAGLYPLTALPDTRKRARNGAFSVYPTSSVSLQRIIQVLEDTEKV